MTKLITLTVFVLSALIFTAGCKKKPVYDTNYSTPVKVYKDKPVKFPDFELTYMGQRENPAITPGGTRFTELLYDFKIKNEDEEKTVSWANSVGIINPVNFEIGGNKFVIELGYSSKIKMDLDEDVIVITKETK
ncbi:MAG TPA: hypothetical protein VGK25_03030 [Ignavibacteria bacterium]|jgi:hypothetical protein